MTWEMLETPRNDKEIVDFVKKIEEDVGVLKSFGLENGIKTSILGPILGMFPHSDLHGDLLQLLKLYAAALQVLQLGRLCSCM